ncbi:MAG TPA: PAS domain S-box protein, partial [Roseimicrobium sp.]|nr:PAS domain S-box protein [Roseimicrobium sp.]
MSSPKAAGSRMDFSNIKTSLIAGVPAPLLVLTAEGRIQAWSFATTNLLGLEADALKGWNICDFAGSPQEEQKIREWLDKQKDPGPLETALLRKDGTALEVEITANMGIGGMRCCQIADLTAEAQVMAELNESRARLRHQTEILNECQAVGGIGSWDINLLTNRLFWTAETYRMHGVDAGHYIPTLESALKFYTAASATLMS